MVREAIRHEDLPLEIHMAQDGEQAIHFIERADTDQDAPCPHVLLLDLNLPKRDGFEVLRQLRASRRCREVPVVVITSSSSPSDMNRAAELGAGYFRKPPSYEEFLKLGAVLKQLLRENGLIKTD